MRIKRNRYYRDCEGRIYGPMIFNKTNFEQGIDNYEAPGHPFRWDRQGSLIRRGIFHNTSLLPSSYDLTEEIALKKKKKQKQK